mmetsp:Transcript_50369/g.163196  ORF Transcript_50369/g.163196 Transcript_50369/m.163196 type:complete len:356 (-) Transcript_50369:213-1280(-)
MTTLLAALAGAVGSFVHYSSTFRILGRLPAKNTRWQVYGLQLCSDKACRSYVDLTQALPCTLPTRCTSGMCLKQPFGQFAPRCLDSTCLNDVHTILNQNATLVFLGGEAALPLHCLSLDKGKDSGAPVTDTEDWAWFEVSLPMTVGVAAVRLFQGSDPNSADLVKLAIRGEGGAFYLAGEAPARQCPTPAAILDNCCKGSTWDKCDYTTILQVTTPAPPLPPPAPPPAPPPGGDERTQAILGKEADDDVDWAMVIPLIVLAIVLITALLLFLWLAYQRGWIFGDGAPPASKHGLGEPSNSNASTNSKPSKPRGGRQQEETFVGPSVSQARPPFKLVSPPAGPHTYAEPGPSEPRW